jgi:YHS domain-containing protein
MPNTPITELDFAAVKNQLRDYLKNQTQFKDYNFEGSNMSVLLDVLAYNTFQNNYYTNMAINEMFLDSAQLKNSIVSHAKELNYIPRSVVSAKAVVKLTIIDTNSTSLTILIPQNARFATNYQGDNYNFVTEKSYLAYRTAPGVYVADNVEIFEGEILSDFEKDGFIFPAEDGFEVLRAVLVNENVDISTIKVFSDDDTEEYTYRKDIYGVQPDDKVFYIESYYDNRYAVVFGGNVFGKQPKDDIDIKIGYRVSSGADVNGANRFSTKFMPNVTVETIEAASGGAPRESLESIKFFAPKSVQIQERAITSNDYAVLIKQRFPQISSISVYGGDELNPPQFGNVAISINLNNNNKPSSIFKRDVANYLADKTPMTIRPIFIDAEFLYATITANVFFTRKTTSKSVGQLEQEIRNKIKEYSDTNLNEFGASLYISQLSGDIDDLSNSILSNSLTVSPYIEYSPILFVSENPSFNFDAELIKPYPFKISQGFSNYKPAIRSSIFNFEGVCCFLQDDGLGNIQIITDDIDANKTVVKPVIGTVDYKTGSVNLTAFTVQGYPGTGIKIIANYLIPDIIAPKNRVFSIKDTDVSINIIEKK